MAAGWFDDSGVANLLFDGFLQNTFVDVVTVDIL
jgi:hypothetical protein